MKDRVSDRWDGKSCSSITGARNVSPLGACEKVEISYISGRITTHPLTPSLTERGGTARAGMSYRIS